MQDATDYIHATPPELFWLGVAIAATIFIVASILITKKDSKTHGLDKKYITKKTQEIFHDFNKNN